MRHFFTQDQNLDDLAKTEILETARRELKQVQMSFNEMVTKTNLICFNGTSANDYIPKGMQSLISTHIFPVNAKQKKTFGSDFSKFLLELSGDVLGYVVENIQEKNQSEFLDILFKVKSNYFFEPHIITHFSYDDLVAYLVDFLRNAAVDNTKRKIEVFDEQASKPWKTLEKVSDLDNIDRTIKTPVILEKPFFGDIHLFITKQGQRKKVQTAFGKLKSVQPNFNRTISNKGELIRSQNKLFLKPKDIFDFRLASTQSKYLLGVSFKGEFVPAVKFITHEIGLKPVKFEDLDFIRVKHERMAVELKPDEIASLEINLDTQQIIIQRSVSKSEFHIARFSKLRLHKNKDSVLIHKTIPFNRGASNFEQIQTFYGTRYTECEKARNILTERGEFGLLGTRSIASGDITSHLVFTSMKLLRFIPFETQCVGIDPQDTLDFSKANETYSDWFQQLKKTFQNIIDVSQTPNFTEHNFNRLTKNIQKFIKIETIDDASNETFEALIAELDHLMEYMDDFFKLNVYSKLQDDLECETSIDLDEEAQEDPLEELASDPENVRLDDQTKNFLTENYAFFNKRSLVLTALMKIERMLFYSKNIKPYTGNKNYQADLVVFKDSTSKKSNYQTVCYPAVALDEILEKSVLRHSGLEDELYFVKFMREFTAKTHQKALELNKSFHHQYKHTLAELTYITDEKLHQLNEELKFLETPENKEAAYKDLHKKITALFNQHLVEKRGNISDLEKEQAEVTERFNKFKSDLDNLIGREVQPDEMEDYLAQAPGELEQLKQEILVDHKKILSVASPIYNAYVTLHRAAISYFNKNLGYSNQFLKALWVHHNRKMFQAVKQDFPAYQKLTPEAITIRIEKITSITYDKSKESAIYKEVRVLSARIKKTVEDLIKIPVKGLFRSKDKSTDNLEQYFDYYETETQKLIGFIKQIKPVYQTLSQYQNLLFKKQEEYVFSRLEKAKNDLQIEVLKLIKKNPDCEAEVNALEKSSEKVPEEIKDELKSLRGVLVKAVSVFNERTGTPDLKTISDYTNLRFKVKYRDELNEVTKELVNYAQGLRAIETEIAGEKDDLAYLVSQEESLEGVAMSKALPSTRVLLKTQYIPLVEKEKAVLKKANNFLAEVISKEDEIRETLISIFFKNRYGAHQFLEGSYCLDVSQSTKDHTEKNINSAYMLIAERFNASCAAAANTTKKISMSKQIMQGIEGLRNRISQIWHGHASDRFVYLPSTLSLDEALELCEYKDVIAKNNPKEGKTAHSFLLIYVNRINFDEIQRNDALKKRYNDAILSNIFVNIDGVKIFNNRESIYEACIRETFGCCGDTLGSDILQKFLYG